MKVKLCGFTKEESLKTAINCGCDFVGFVFYEKSPRNITPLEAKELAKIIPPHIAKVAVVVNPNQELISEIISNLKPNFIQFHGNESVEYLKDFKKNFPHTKIIKAFGIRNKEDLNSLKDYENYADYFLLDNKSDNEFGGSGEKFDWEILKEISTTKEWFLSGGLNEKNISSALQTSKAKMIDISSGIEEIRGEKSSLLIEQFMKKIKDYAA